MAMMIFAVLNGLGIVFLVYALVQFWKEGRRPKGAVRQYETDFMREVKPEVIVVTHPISGGLQVADAPKPALWRRRVEPAPVSHSAQGGLSTIPLQTRMGGLRGKQDHRGPFDTTGEMPMKRFSTR